jgi:membrane-bound inhibitor of C-type lysozyme
MTLRAARIPVLLLLMGAALGGCAWPWQRHARSPAAGEGPATAYACADGRGFTAAYPEGGARAVVRADGAAYALPQVPAASGARYAKGKVELSTKGAGAMLTGVPRPRRDCRAG